MGIDFNVDVNVKTHGAEKIDALEKQINSLKTESIKVKVDVDQSSLSKLKLNTSGLKIKPAVDTSGVQQATAKIKSQISAQKIQFKVDTGQTVADIAKIEAKMKNLGSSSYIKSSEFQNAYNVLEKFKNIKLDSSNIDQYNTALKTCQNYIQAATADLSTMATESQRISLKNSLQKTLKENSAYTKEAKSELELYISEVDKLGSSMTKLDYTRISNGLKTINSDMANQGKVGKNWIEELGRGFKQISQFAYTYGAIQRIPEVVGKMVSEVIKVDDAITNLRMATSISNDEALSLMSTYSKLGDELKATGVDVATSATEWLKQGKSIQESQNLAKDSIVLSKIGDLSSEEATKTITAAMKSYDIAENEVMGFVDKISAIDLVSATDVGGLSQAFNEVAANAKNAGVEAEKLLSYAAVIGETTQEGMASVGTSLNAIFSRMGNIKLSRLKDYETGEDLSNVETVLRGVGIQLRDSQDQFRDFDDVLDDTANRWSSFSNVQQRAVAQAFSGTHHMNEFMILMKNWNKVQEYTQTANEASGQSMEKFAAYQESATGKIEGFKNSFQTLSTTTIDSNLFKGVIDSGTGLLEILTKIIDVGGGIPVVLGAIGGVALFKNLD